ncbi:MAG: hypothetical protein WDA75_09965, partial [Candidatus Latescibacterota bacterium]
MRHPKSAGAAPRRWTSLGATCALLLVVGALATGANAQIVQVADVFAFVDYGITGVMIPVEWQPLADSVSQVALSDARYPHDIYFGWVFLIGDTRVTAAYTVYSKYGRVNTAVAIHLATPANAQLTTEQRDALVAAGFASREGTTLGDTRGAVEAAYGVPTHSAGWNGRWFAKLWYWVGDDRFTLNSELLGTFCSACENDPPSTFEALYL